MNSEDNNKAMPHHLIVSEIARDTRLPRDVVDIVIKRYLDIAIEQIANGRGFKMKNVFTVSYHQTPERMSPQGDKIVPPRGYLRLKASDTIKDLYTVWELFYQDKDYVINRDTWTGAAKWMRSKDHRIKIAQAKAKRLAEYMAGVNAPTSFPSSKSSNVIKSKPAPENQDIYYNPLLDDDE